MTSHDGMGNLVFAKVVELLDFYHEVCGYVSDESAVNELLQTAVSAQPNDESISMNPTRVARCLPKRKCLCWKTAVETIRDGTGPFKVAAHLHQGASS